MIKKSIFVCHLLLAGGSAASAATVFSADFTTLAGTGTIRNLSDGGWDGYIGNTTTPATAPASASGDYRAGTVSGSNGSLSNYLFAQNQTGATAGIDYFLFTTSTVTPFAPADYTGMTASWSRNGEGLTTGSFYYLTLQVGGSWYASQNGFNTTTAPSFNVLASTWNNLVVDTTAGTGSLALGGTISTYSDLFGAGQLVTGVGFFIDDLAVNASANRTIRLDNIVIDAVPEPSAAFLCVIGGLSLLGHRRRAKSN